MRGVVRGAQVDAQGSPASQGQQRRLAGVRSQARWPAADRPRPGRVGSGPRRVIRALRYASDELTRASEAIIRSARAPQPRPRVQATAAEARDTAERLAQAA